GAAVKSHVEAEHVVGTHPSVVMGVNEASDVAGVVRVALSGWGGCVADWKSAPPRTLKATLKVARPKEKGEAGPTVAASEVKFEPNADATATTVAGCLEGKMKALQFKTPKDDSLTVPY